MRGVPVSFTTDCICGFPGESEEDFVRSCGFLEEVGFLRVHVFPYSRREGTPAYDFPQQVHEREKQARSRRMHDRAEEVRRAVLAGLEGSEDQVLLETPVSATVFTGYTRLYVPVSVSAPGLCRRGYRAGAAGPLRRRPGPGGVPGPGLRQDGFTLWIRYFLDRFFGLSLFKGRKMC